MSIEIMIYVYLFVCSSMIIFNIVTAFLFKYRDKKTVRISEDFQLKVNEQLSNIKNGQHCDEVHKQYMRKKLKKIGNMVAFDKMLESAFIENPEMVKKYLSELDGVFIDLSVDYCGRDRIETAYFPYIIKKYRLLADKTIPAIEEMLLNLIDEPSIYCRENVLQALYTTGNCECILKAIKKIDKGELFFHGKILSDGLLNFAGNTEKLIFEIISEFDKFSDEMQVTLLDYIRFSSSKHCEFFHLLLCDENRNDEIHYCAIRYLGKYKYEKAYDMLCELAEDSKGDKWQYSAIASTALSNYPSEKTIQILKNNLYSKNWYIRYNSAKSLKNLGVKYSEISDIIDGNDRYASEILRYVLENDESKRRVAAV